MASPPRPFHLVLVPAVVTLLVTGARLFGELQGWSPRYFSTAPGGGSALVGITWLVPVFGAWFGWRLARDGRGPDRAGRALLLHALAFLVYLGGFQAVIHVLRFDTATHGGLVAQLLCMGGASVLAALTALWAWPGLFAVQLLYALLARVPVAAVTYLAVFNRWGTHYEKYGPGDYQGMAPLEHASWLGYTQLVFWPAFTVAVGGLFGALAALLGRRRPG